MAQITVHSSNSAASATSPLVITKPTGLAVGDLLVATLAVSSGAASGSPVIDTPAGWTSATSVTGGGNGARIVYKIADSSDVAASNFSFTATSLPATPLFAGGLTRMSNFFTTSVIEDSFTGTTNSATVDTTFSFTGSLDFTVPNCVLVALFVASDPQAANPANVSGYTASQSVTWSEIFDLGGFSSNTCLSAAYAEYTGTTAITSFGATLSAAFDNHSGIIVAIRPYYPTTGTNALLDVSPVNFAQNGIGGTTGSNNLLTASTETFDANGRATTPSQWLNDSNPTTTWTNETL